MGDTELFLIIIGLRGDCLALESNYLESFVPEVCSCLTHIHIYSLQMTNYVS
jgi:hypothetical protein